MGDIARYPPRPSIPRPFPPTPEDVIPPQLIAQLEAM